MTANDALERLPRQSWIWAAEPEQDLDEPGDKAVAWTVGAAEALRPLVVRALPRAQR